jgi:DMSO/TMAO reductase YedYZ molybdopterin-dependent catalytic subunit
MISGRAAQARTPALIAPPTRVNFRAMVPSAHRIPKGNRPTRAFPVVHIDEPAPFDARAWDLRVVGLVEHPLRFSWDEFRALPRVVREGDFHCVLGFSRLANRWEGVALRDVLGRAGVKPAARFVRFSDDRAYETTIPIAVAADGGALLADTHDGRALSLEHGAPVRAVVPELWSWKSCKWIRTIELLETDKPGFWESRGQPAHGNPWA